MARSSPAVVLYQAALPHLERFHIEVSPRALVKNISISEQQLLQIARALTNRSAEVLILDEPTTSLTEQETERLFRIVRRLKDEKHSVVFISHKLEEIYALGDEITVMRNGEQVANAPIAEITQRQLIVHMSGRDFDLDETFRPELPPASRCSKSRTSVELASTKSTSRFMRERCLASPD
jgi:ribose transport system ATP-binding protein